MTALAEGSSFLLLLFVAMPMKYLMGMPRVVTVVGAIHGVLFLLYIGQLAKLHTKHQLGQSVFVLRLSGIASPVRAIRVRQAPS